MNFGLNTVQNHHLEPRNRLDLIMMELPESSSEAAGSTAVEFDGGGGGGGGEAEREHMFDKVVTPSDVGKLNRLVIPKQHAERFFPLDSSTNEKGLLLNFEDRNGKSWRFRYSYWNSSQSYVMTKGWSRFVKEKRLDAGDIVSFQRGVGEIGRDRLYIDWRRRPELPIHLNNHHHHHHHHAAVGIQPSIVVPTSGTTWGPLVWQPLSPATTTGYHPHPAAATPRDQTHLSQINNNSNKNYSRNNNVNNVNVMYDWNRGCCSYGYGSVVETSSGVVYLRTEVGRSAPRLGDEEEEEEEGNDQVQQEYYKGSGSMGVVQGNCRTKNNNYNNHNKSSNKDEDEDEDQGEDTPVKRSRLRLFGVNMEMECPNSSSSDECHLLLSSSNSNPKTTTITTPAAATHQFQFQLPSPSHPRQI